MSTSLITKKYSMSELVEAAEKRSGKKVLDMHFWCTMNGFDRLSWYEGDKQRWGNPSDEPVSLACMLTGLKVVAAVFHMYSFDNVLEVVYESEEPRTESIMMTPAAFEDALMGLWAAQQELTVKIGGLLDVCGFKSDEYVDWFNDYCLGEGDQIERLLDLYREKYDKESEKCR